MEEVIQPKSGNECLDPSVQDLRLQDLRLRYSGCSLIIHEVTKIFIDIERLMTQSYQFEAMKNTMKSLV